MTAPHPLRDRLVGRALTGSRGVVYVLDRCLAEGGQGWIFEASWDDGDGIPVVVKVLKPDALTEDALKRFQREAQVLRRLSEGGAPTPYIVRFFDHFQVTLADGDGPPLAVLPFTVLEYVDGESLDDVLEAARRRGGFAGLPLRRVRRIIKHVARALDTVHAQGVVHRDLKPSNILLTASRGVESAKVTDFGLARDMTTLDQTTQFAGASVGYAPPEQYEKGNSRVGVWTDVFALAAIAYEALTGRRAFPLEPGQNPIVILAKILRGERPSLRAALPPELADEPAAVEALDALFRSALAAEPDGRPATAGAFLAAFEAALEPVIARQPESRALAMPSLAMRLEDFHVDERSERQEGPSGAPSAIAPSAYAPLTTGRLPGAERTAQLVQGGLGEGPLFGPFATLRRADGRAWTAGAFSSDGALLVAHGEGTGLVAFQFVVDAAGRASARPEPLPIPGLAVDTTSPVPHIAIHGEFLAIATEGAWAVARLRPEALANPHVHAHTLLGGGPAHGGGRIRGIAAAADGALWILESHGSGGAVTRVDAGRAEAPVPLPFAPRAAVSAAGGLLIFGARGALGRVALEPRGAARFVRVGDLGDVDLRAAVATAEGVFAVGAGGYAFRTDTAGEQITLLPVGTSRDLRVAAAGRRDVLVGACDGRLLQLDRGVLSRIGDGVSEADVLAVAVGERRVRVFYADGVIAGATREA